MSRPATNLAAATSVVTENMLRTPSYLLTGAPDPTASAPGVVDHVPATDRAKPIKMPVHPAVSDPGADSMMVDPPASGGSNGTEPSPPSKPAPPTKPSKRKKSGGGKAPATAPAGAAAPPADAAAGPVESAEPAAAGAAEPGGPRKTTKSMTVYDCAADLATDDDILCDIFVDNALGFQTHKMQKDYSRIEVDPVALEEVMLNMGADLDVDKAFHRLFGADGVVPRDTWDESRVARLSTPQFEEHARRYLRMFLPFSGYCIQPDDRYAGDRVDDRKLGGRIVVTRQFQKGEQIDMLYGCIAEVTPEEEHTLLRQGENDFSVMFSNRRDRSQLWLGPAAYINHDCKPTCKFVATGDSASVITLRDLDICDEVTCCYGTNFFGKDNEYCGCPSCEAAGKGLYRGKVKATTARPTDTEYHDGRPATRNRQASSASEARSAAASVEPASAVSPIELGVEPSPVVFVADPDNPFWVPGLLVPAAERTADMPACKSDSEVVVQCFADGTFLKVAVTDTAQFIIGMRPYTDYVQARGSVFLMHPGVQYATEFCVKNKLPKHMGWPGRVTSAKPKGKSSKADKTGGTDRFRLEKSERDEVDLVGTVALVESAGDRSDPQPAVILGGERRYVTVTIEPGRRQKVLTPYYRVRYLNNPRACAGPVADLKRGRRRRILSDAVSQDGGFEWVSLTRIRMCLEGMKVPKFPDFDKAAGSEAASRSSSAGPAVPSASEARSGSGGSSPPRKVSNGPGVAGKSKLANGKEKLAAAKASHSKSGKGVNHAASNGDSAADGKAHRSAKTHDGPTDAAMDVGPPPSAIQAELEKISSKSPNGRKRMATAMAPEAHQGINGSEDPVPTKPKSKRRRSTGEVS